MGIRDGREGAAGCQLDGAGGQPWGCWGAGGQLDGAGGQPWGGGYWAGYCCELGQEGCCGAACWGAWGGGGQPAEPPVEADPDPLSPPAGATCSSACLSPSPFAISCLR
jgi:hypothetical protein